MKPQNAKRGIAWRRLAGVTLTVVASVAAAYYVQPLIHGNDEAINTVVTVFSILAGFLIAVITFIGDPSAKGWQELQLDKRQVEAKLRRHRILFYCYLITLGLALAMFVLPESFVETTVWLERAFVGSAVFVFLASFALPKSLTSLQMEAYNTALKDQLPKPLQGNGEKKD